MPKTADLNDHLPAERMTNNYLRVQRHPVFQDQRAIVFSEAFAPVSGARRA